MADNARNILDYNFFTASYLYWQSQFVTKYLQWERCRIKQQLRNTIATFSSDTLKIRIPRFDFKPQSLSHFTNG